MAVIGNLAFWRFKTPLDNQWHPVPGASPAKYRTNLPAWVGSIDVQAAVVDVAPFIAGAGTFAHLSQLNHLGWTVHASVFRNVKTMLAMQRTLLLLTPAVFLAQAVGFDYRYAIPRWAHERERRRDEVDVRQQVDVGMGLGLLTWLGRMYVFHIGKRYWAPLDVVMGGALADLMHREYIKAHGL